MLPLICEAQIRYRQAAQICRIEQKTEENSQSKSHRKEVGSENSQLINSSTLIEVFFDVPQRAITP